MLVVWAKILGEIYETRRHMAESTLQLFSCYTSLGHLLDAA